MKPILEVENLTLILDGSKILDNVSFVLHEGETLAFIGESGSGKTSLAKTILGFYRPQSGSIKIRGKSLLELSNKDLLLWRRQMGVVFQDQGSALNMKLKVRKILEEPFVTHENLSKKNLNERLEFLLEKVGLPYNTLEKYPRDLSGGQLQRVGIARAVALDPEILICDEPTTALDPSIRALILNLFKKFQKNMLWISHDLLSVSYIAQKIAIFYKGRLLEIGLQEDIFSFPKHPYTAKFVNSFLKDPKNSTPDWIPTPCKTEGCRLAISCPYSSTLCQDIHPQLRGSTGHKFACHNPLTPTWS